MLMTTASLAQERYVEDDSSGSLGSTISDGVTSMSGASAYVPTLLCSAVFLPCLTYSEWYIDELFAVLRNPDARGESSLYEVFTNDFWGNPLYGENAWTHKSYRPLAVLSFAGQFKMLGDLFRPQPLRAFNVALHSTNSVLVQRLLHRGLGLTQHWSQLAACLFAAHPVHTENIVYLVGRADKLSTLGWLLATLCHLHVRRCPTSDRLVPLSSMCGLLLLCAALAVVAALCKESGLTLLVFNAGIELCSIEGRARTKPASWRGALVALLALGLFVALAFARFQITQGSSAPFGYVDTPIQYHDNRIARTWSYLNQHAFYAKLAIFPGKLSWDYSYDAIPVLRAGAADVRALGVLATYLAILALSSWSLSGRGLHLRPQRAVLLGLLFALIPFVPASNLFFVVGVTVGERLLYTSTVGVVAVMAALGEHLELGRLQGGKRSGRKPRRWPWWLACALLAVYVFRCGRRVLQWQSSETLYAADVESWPRSTKTQHQIGTVYHHRGRYDEALHHYTASLNITDDNALTDHCVAQIYIETAQYQKALERYEKIISGHLVGFAHTNIWMLWVDYGFTLVTLQQYEEGIPRLQKGLARNRDLPHGLNALGYAFYQLGEIQQAQDTLVQALDYDPENPLIWNNLAAVWLRAGAFQEALNALERALSLEPENPSVLFNAFLLQKAAENGGLLEAPPRLDLFFMRIG